LLLFLTFSWKTNTINWLSVF